jgi:hypothetical protein
MKNSEEKRSKVKGLRKWSFVAFGAFLSASQLYAATPDLVAEVRKQLFPSHSDEQLADGTQKYKGNVIQLAQEEYYDYVPGSNLPYVPDYYAYSAYGDYYNYSNYSDNT